MGTKVEIDYLENGVLRHPTPQDRQRYLLKFCSVLSTKKNRKLQTWNKLVAVLLEIRENTTKMKKWKFRYDPYQ